MIATLLLPGEDAECDPRKYDDETGGAMTCPRSSVSSALRWTLLRVASTHWHAALCRLFTSSDAAIVSCFHLRVYVYLPACVSCDAGRPEQRAAALVRWTARSRSSLECATRAVK
jgi:hypothetical protein